MHLVRATLPLLSAGCRAAGRITAAEQKICVSAAAGDEADEAHGIRGGLQQEQPLFVDREALWCDVLARSAVVCAALLSRRGAAEVCDGAVSHEGDEAVGVGAVAYCDDEARVGGVRHYARRWTTHATLAAGHTRTAAEVHTTRTRAAHTVVAARPVIEQRAYTADRVDPVQLATGAVDGHGSDRRQTRLAARPVSASAVVACVASDIVTELVVDRERVDAHPSHDSVRWLSDVCGAAVRIHHQACHSAVQRRLLSCATRPAVRRVVGSSEPIERRSSAYQCDHHHTSPAQRLDAARVHLEEEQLIALRARACDDLMYEAPARGPSSPAVLIRGTVVAAVAVHVVRPDVADGQRGEVDPLDLRIVAGQVVGDDEAEAVR